MRTTRGFKVLPCALILLVTATLVAPPSFGFGAFTHEAIIEYSWKRSIVPALLKRFPTATGDQLRVARSYGLVFSLPERLRARYRQLGYAPGEGCEWLAPLPAVYLLDRDGMVVLALLELDYRNRFNPEPLLHALHAIQSRRATRPRLF